MPRVTPTSVPENPRDLVVVVETELCDELLLLLPPDFADPPDNCPLEIP